MIEEIVDQINELGRRVIFLGDGVDVFRDYINEHVKVDYDFAPAMCLSLIHISEFEALHAQAII